MKKFLQFLVAEDIRGYHAWYYLPETNSYFVTSEDDEPGVMLTPEQQEVDSNRPYVAGRDIREKMRNTGYEFDPRNGSKL